MNNFSRIHSNPVDRNWFSSIQKNYVYIRGKPSIVRWDGRITIPKSSFTYSQTHFGPSEEIVQLKTGYLFLVLLDIYQSSLMANNHLTYGFFVELFLRINKNYMKTKN